MDTILTPVSIDLPPTLDELKSKSWNPYVNDIFTISSSLAGLPSLVVPVQREPTVCLQLIGKWGSDERILSVGKSIESS